MSLDLVTSWLAPRPRPPDPEGDDVILNPRRSPRVAVRREARIIGASGCWSARTEDVGPRGCQLVGPVALVTGTALRVVLSGDATMGELSVPGKVVWARDVAPFRAGIAFSPAHAGAAARWFDHLVGGRPERVERAIPAGATLFLAAPPRFCADFTREEASIILAVGPGVRAGALREQLRDRWSEARHALFSLLARRVVTTLPGEAAPPSAWDGFRAELCAQVLGDAQPRPAAPARPTLAQSLYEAALADLHAGQLADAIVMLRKALARSPGDREIAGTLARVAFAGLGRRAS